MKFSIQQLINTLIDIITGSPTSILFIVLGTIFTVAMIINIRKNKTIGKTLFVSGWIFIIVFIIIKYNSYLSKLFDNLINTVFMQIFFPNIATYLIIIIITNIIFLYTILNKNSKTNSKIINSTFFTIIMVIMIMTIEQISKNKINVYVQEEVYTNKNILALIEATTLIFGIWLLIILSKIVLKKLINKSNEKIKKEFKEKEIAEIKDTSSQIIEQTLEPAVEPVPIIEPTVTPTVEPTPTIESTLIPTVEPTPTIESTLIPTVEPTPTIEPTLIPTVEPTPTIESTLIPTAEPTSIEPTMIPNPFEQTMMPTVTPIVEPMPTLETTMAPIPTVEPILTIEPITTPNPFEQTIAPTPSNQNINSQYKPLTNENDEIEIFKL